VATLQIHDFGKTEGVPSHRHLIALAARASFAATVVTRFFVVVHGSDPALSTLASVFDELGLAPVGVIRIDGTSAQPTLDRKPRGGTVPERRPNSIG
jgi:hypothetical protein